MSGSSSRNESRFSAAPRPDFTHQYPDDPRQLPEGSVVDGALAQADAEDSADYVIIGSGAAGASAADVLTREGYSVILLEEGPWVRTRDFGVDVYPAMKNMFRDVGGNVTLGRAMLPVLQGSCVGGSTTINSAIAWRAPEAVIDRWSHEFGLRDTLSYARLDRHYTELERALHVRTMDDQGVLGGHNSIFLQSAARLGIRAEKAKRYDGGCQATASCLTGCRTGKKLSMNVTYIPAALRRGARIYISTRAVRIETAYGRARSVLGASKAPGSPLLRVHARRGVIVAASAVQTPGILARSRIRARALGQHFQAHPGTSLIGRFADPVAQQFGATQGTNSTQFLESDHYKIEALSFPPEMFAMRIPGLGPEFVQNMLEYPYTLNWAVVVRGAGEGRIRPGIGKELVQYSPTPLDMTRLRKGLRTLSEMMFAAGAREIWPYVYGMPKLRRPDDLRLWDSAPNDPRAYGMMVSHLFGSTRMGPDPRTSVVNLDFQVHGMHGLSVLDSSLFPTNLGVNPQHTIMAVARLGAYRILERARG